MSPDLPEQVLGIDVDEEEDRASEEEEDVELEWFVFVTVGEFRLAVPVEMVRSIEDPPESVTRVPRTPEAIEGVMDIRGEITAVIEPRVHFPAEEPRSEKQKLLVFDRELDRQQAAIRVDEVVGVVGVPEENVKEADEYESTDVAGGALEHPLVAAIVEEEQTATVDPGESTRPDRPDDEEADGPIGWRRGDRDLTSKFGGDDDEIGEEFTLEEEEDEAAEADEAEEVEQIVVEMTALVDVDLMLRASSRAAA